MSSLEAFKTVDMNIGKTIIISFFLLSCESKTANLAFNYFSKGKDKMCVVINDTDSFFIDGTGLIEPKFKKEDFNDDGVEDLMMTVFPKKRIIYLFTSSLESSFEKYKMQSFIADELFKVDEIIFTVSNQVVGESKSLLYLIAGNNYKVQDSLICYGECDEQNPVVYFDSISLSAFWISQTNGIK